jgi:hypothetical protein
VVSSPGPNGLALPWKERRRVGGHLDRRSCGLGPRRTSDTRHSSGATPRQGEEHGASGRARVSLSYASGGSLNEGHHEVHLGMANGFAGSGSLEGSDALAETARRVSAAPELGKNPELRTG